MKRWYVYALIRDGIIVQYIGKGSGRRHKVSARRHGGECKILAEFDSERSALKYEREMIAKHKPELNKTKGGEGRSRIRRKSDAAIEAKWRSEAYANENSGFWVDKLIAQCFRKCEQNEALKAAANA